MTALESALLEAVGVLDRIGIPYMLIGGLAVSLWGEPRSTLDVDITVWVDPGELGRAVSELSKILHPTPSDPLAFVQQTRVLPAMSSQKLKIDIIFASLPEEQRMIERARPKRINGQTVMVASVEDLLFMKLASERSKDIEDARLLLRRFRKSIDRTYLEPRLKELAEGLARPDILAIYNEESAQ
ncbi:MAG TPA: nucleotidyl transferase AbiEii/AbiGii toxin family protein [Bryobacteraceae bacterium]|nr:nucleotidyl transferase AbiEii/AbiGii toxin family protein [Bryobacteraceae bacterium]